MESRREMRSELTRRLEPIVTALAALECSSMIQQNQLYSALVKGKNCDAVRFDILL